MFTDENAFFPGCHGTYAVQFYQNPSTYSGRIVHMKDADSRMLVAPPYCLWPTRIVFF